MQIEDGVLKISVSYGLKVGGPNYSSENVNLSMSTEWPISGDLEVAQAQGREAESSMFRNLQLSAFAYLGITEFNELPNGRLEPVLPEVAKPAKRSGGYNAPKRQGNNDYGPPKADPDSIPEYTVTLSGGDTLTVKDLRGLKANGTYAANAPDFRDGQRPIWLKNKEGQINGFAAAIAEAVDKQSTLEAPY